MSKIIQAVFSSGKFATTTDVFQWDKGDILQIEGLDLPGNYEVHFANSLNTPALVVSASGNTVETPAEVFENSGREVYAWVVVLESANVYHTIGQVRIPINPRGMPADLIPTPGYIPDRSKSAIKEAVDSWLAEHRPEFNDGVPYAVKDALITLFEHVAYTDDQGETYLNNLKRAFALVKSLVSIEATLDTGGEEITDSDTLGTLRQYLTVTATYDDGSTATITDYTLSGTLEIGVSTIVVTYGTASDTVDVTVTGTKTLLSISAVFDDGGATIYDTDDPTLEDLRQYLTVTAYYDDSSSREVINYTLSGELAVGDNTITVSYNGKTTTFNVTVTHRLLPSGYTRATYVASPDQSTRGPFVDTGVTPSTNGSISIDIDFMMLEEESIFKYIISIHSGASVSSAGIIVGIPGTNEKVTAYNGITAAIIPNGGASMVNQRIAVTANYSPTTASITDGTLSDSASGTGREHGYPIYLFGLKDKGSNTMSYIMKARIYACTVKDNGTTILDLIPCTRDSDSAAGFWDVVNESFITASGLVAG